MPIGFPTPHIPHYMSTERHSAISHGSQFLHLKPTIFFETQNDYCLLFACFQMQMNVHCLARKCVKGASVWIQRAAMNVTARLDRIMILPSCSAEVTITHRKIIVFVCLLVYNFIIQTVLFGNMNTLFYRFFVL